MENPQVTQFTGRGLLAWLCHEPLLDLNGLFCDNLMIKTASFSPTWCQSIMVFICVCFHSTVLQQIIGWYLVTQIWSLLEGWQRSEAVWTFFTVIQPNKSNCPTELLLQSPWDALVRDENDTALDMQHKFKPNLWKHEIYCVHVRKH